MRCGCSKWRYEPPDGTDLWTRTPFSGFQCHRLFADTGHRQKVGCLLPVTYGLYQADIFPTNSFWSALRQMFLPEHWQPQSHRRHRVNTKYPLPQASRQCRRIRRRIPQWYLPTRRHRTALLPADERQIRFRAGQQQWHACLQPRTGYVQPEQSCFRHIPACAFILTATRGCQSCECQSIQPADNTYTRNPQSFLILQSFNFRHISIF